MKVTVQILGDELGPCGLFRSAGLDRVGLPKAGQMAGSKLFFDPSGVEDAVIHGLGIGEIHDSTQQVRILRFHQF